MNILEWIPYIFLAIAVLVIVTAPVLGIGSLLLLRQIVQRELVPLVFWLIGLVIIIGPIQSGRNLSGLALVFEAEAEDFANTLWINRLVSVCFLVIGAERVVRWLLSREKTAWHGAGLLVAVVLFSVSNHFINAWLGTVPAFSHHAFYALLLLVAGYLVANEDHLRSVLAARNAVLVILVLSAVAAAVQPQLVLQSGYTGGYLPVRYWGLGTHANVLSPLTVLLIAILMVHPFQRRWLTRLAFVLALVSLVATQSKTALAAAVVVVGVLWAWRFRAGLGPQGVFHRPAVPTVALVILGAMGLCLAVLVAQVGFDVSTRVERFFGSSTGASVTSLSNRDLIWAHALREWQENPWFGYGTTIFDARYRLSIGLQQAFHAHNQFLQSLGAAGYLGAAGLVVYGLTLGFHAVRAAGPTGGLSLALFLFILMRSITEIPLTLRAASSAEFLIHLTLFMVCIGGARQARAAQRQPLPGIGPAWASAGASGMRAS